MKNWLKKIWIVIEESQQRRADYYMLTKFTDRELNDLGISRSQIREIIYGKNANRKTTEVS
jgi:uncharacterized protein YjiS (DUF1127 family)